MPQTPTATPDDLLRLGAQPASGPPTVDPNFRPVQQDSGQKKQQTTLTGSLKHAVTFPFENEREFRDNTSVGNQITSDLAGGLGSLAAGAGLGFAFGGPPGAALGAIGGPIAYALSRRADDVVDYTEPQNFGEFAGRFAPGAAVDIGLGVLPVVGPTARTAGPLVKAGTRAAYGYGLDLASQYANSAATDGEVPFTGQPGLFTGVGAASPFVGNAIRRAGQARGSRGAPAAAAQATEAAAEVAPTPTGAGINPASLPQNQPEAVTGLVNAYKQAYEQFGPGADVTRLYQQAVIEAGFDPQQILGAAPLPGEGFSRLGQVSADATGAPTLNPTPTRPDALQGRITQNAGAPYNFGPGEVPGSTVPPSPDLPPLLPGGTENIIDGEFSEVLPPLELPPGQGPAGLLTGGVERPPDVIPGSGEVINLPGGGRDPGDVTGISNIDTPNADAAAAALQGNVTAAENTFQQQLADAGQGLPSQQAGDDLARIQQAVSAENTQRLDQILQYAETGLIQDEQQLSRLMDEYAERLQLLDPAAQEQYFDAAARIVERFDTGAGPPK